jgi:hypothetical protein
MHDPSTLALQIKLPFGGTTTTFKDGTVMVHRPVLVCIWHKDPETDGSDDSCDWFCRNVPEDLKKKAIEEGEKQWKYFFEPNAYSSMRFSSDLEILWAVWNHVAYFFDRKWKDRTKREINAIFNLTANPADNISHSIQIAKKDPQGMAHLFVLVTSLYLQTWRPWYRHPRWHIHHWRIVIPFLQDFKRWAFSRCASCGKRFPWGYSPVTTNWNSKGPQWFRSEDYTYHENCVPTPKRNPYESR